MATMRSVNNRLRHSGRDELVRPRADPSLVIERVIADFGFIGMRII
jgi:hypothetical protein